MYGYFRLFFGEALAPWVFGAWVSVLIFLVLLCLNEAPAEFRYMDL